MESYIEEKKNIGTKNSDRCPLSAVIRKLLLTLSKGKNEIFIIIPPPLITPLITLPSSKFLSLFPVVVFLPQSRIDVPRPVSTNALWIPHNH